MSIRYLFVASLLIGSIPLHAQEPLPTPTSLAAAAARRWPQPVRVGDLLRRQVLAPHETQHTLGWVRDLVKRPDGSIDVVVDYGGIFGLFTRPIAVPVDAMALLGQYMEIIGYTSEQLEHFETVKAAGLSLSPETIIKVGLIGPSH